MLKRSLLIFSPVLIGLTTGCATKQTWVPELEDAQNTYAQISQDPIVASLAEEDLQSAARQLQRAEDAAASFRKPQTVAHQARIATLQTLTAQQRARALSANHSVQTALGQNPLLSEEKIAAATIVESPMVDFPLGAEPVMAAATPAGSGDIQAQLLALSQQLASLQAQLANSQTSAPQAPSAIQEVAAVDTVPTPVSDDSMLAAESIIEWSPEIQTNPAPVQAVVEPVQPISDEPVMSAAMEVAPRTAEERPVEQSIHRKLRAMNAKPNTRGMSLSLGDRYFDSGTARLMRPRAARHLDNVAAVMKQNPSLDLFIEGHTDNQADPENSQDLSVNRAVAIKSALVLRGIDAGRIDAIGYGDTQPVADNESPLGRLQNRRVELIFPVPQVGS